MQSFNLKCDLSVPTFLQNPILSELPPPPVGKFGWPWTIAYPSLPDAMTDGAYWPKVTIVTPSYNQAQFIEETLRSVLLQGYPNLEYIVMDGGSTDGTAEIISKYKSALSYVHVGRDGGQAAAIAEGFRHATGTILAWLNSDDCYEPGALDRVAAFFAKHPRVVFGNGDVYITDTASRRLYRQYAIRPSRLLTANLGAHSWPQQGCFWRRSAYQHVGGLDEHLHFCMDRDLFLRLVSFGPSARISGPPLACFRVHDDAKSSTMLDVAEQEHLLLLGRYGFPRLLKWRALLQFCWWLWVKPASLRVRLNRAFGWEL